MPLLLAARVTPWPASVGRALRLGSVRSLQEMDRSQFYSKQSRVCSKEKVNLNCPGQFTPASFSWSQRRFLSQFVPESRPVTESSIEQFQHFVDKSKRLFVLTGAGISTESGIPDYRSDEVGLYARSDRKPIQYRDFVHSPSRRQRYWARNYVGWPQFSSFLPNQSHLVLAEWEKVGKIHWLVTQNVDALHTKAGSRCLTELHGCSNRIICMNCKTLTKQECSSRENDSCKPELPH